MHSFIHSFIHSLFFLHHYSHLFGSTLLVALYVSDSLKRTNSLESLVVKLDNIGCDLFCGSKHSWKSLLRVFLYSVPFASVEEYTSKNR